MLLILNLAKIYRKFNFLLEKSKKLFYNLSMKNFEEIVEYFDELFSENPGQRDFFLKLIEENSAPSKLLSVGCGTGTFEHVISKKGCDVTGIDYVPELLESASLRRRIPGVSIRFFHMTTVEMRRFLKNGFYNIISCLNNRIASINDEILLKKFFFDCKHLLADKGSLILHLPNYLFFKREPVVYLPVAESIRAKMLSKIITSNTGEKKLFQLVETGKGRRISVVEDEPIFPITMYDINDLAKEAGFTKITYYSDFNGSEFIPESSEWLVCRLI
ncbi:MAG: class I SAM-dependent methyltransferase [Spirochaetaceae bacterium]|nr:class I SAM-dependent methyltransferase [Spirochaetaceae bacterium]